MEAIQPTLFDYQQLDPETRIVVQQRTGEIKALMKRTAQDIIEIGEKIIDVKGRLGHGYFGPWLKAEFEWSYELANRFINVARQFNSVNFTDLDFAPSALYLLAAPSTSDEARQEAIERAQNGETITHAAAKEIVNGHNSPAFPDDRRPYVLYPDGRQEFTTLESIQKTKAFLDEKGIDYFTCSVCQDMFDIEVWHCSQCDHHWPFEKEQCSNCYNYRIPRNYLRDNRRSQVSDIYVPLGMDACQTPAYAVDPLLRYLQEGWNIWEPAAGEGYLEGALYDSGFSVIPTDILTGQNFFKFEPKNWNCLVTNPPYSIVFLWLERCYELGKPFALLLKVDILGTKGAQELFNQFGVEVIFVNPRISFKMPRKGWEGGGAQFPTAWFTWGLNIGQQMTFTKVIPEDAETN